MRRLNPKVKHFKLNLTPTELVVLRAWTEGKLPLVLTPTQYAAKNSVFHKIQHLGK